MNIVYEVEIQCVQNDSEYEAGVEYDNRVWDGDRHVF
jgi:hypothetical protein